MKNHVRVLVAAFSLSAAFGITTMGTTQTAEARRPLRAVVSFDNTRSSSVSCKVYRDDNNQLITTLTQSAKKKTWKRFHIPSDKPLMYMKCPGGPSGNTMVKMRTKLDGKKIADKGWFVSCNPTGCVANVKTIRRA